MLGDREQTEAMSEPDRKYPVTPDGRYFVVKETLWRTSNPALGPDVRDRLVHSLMSARRTIGAALRSGDRQAEAKARTAVHDTKTALGERGAVWWDDGAPDLNRHKVTKSVYARWFAGLSD